VPPGWRIPLLFISLAASFGIGAAWKTAFMPWVRDLVPDDGRSLEGLAPLALHPVPGALGGGLLATLLHGSVRAVGHGTTGGATSEDSEATAHLAREGHVVRTEG